MMDLFPGFNLLHEAHEGSTPTPTSLVLIEKDETRPRCSVNGYTHENRAYLNGPTCNVCEHITPSYVLACEHFFKPGNWVVAISHNTSPELYAMLIERHFVLAPVSGETMGEAIESLTRYMPMLLSADDEILVSRISQNVVTYTVKYKEEGNDDTLYMHFHIMRLIDEASADGAMSIYLDAVATVCNKDLCFIHVENEQSSCDCDEIIAELLVGEDEEEDDDCEGCNGCNGCRCEDCDEEDCDGCDACACDYDWPEDVCLQCRGCNKNCDDSPGCANCEHNTITE